MLNFDFIDNDIDIKSKEYHGLQLHFTFEFKQFSPFYKLEFEATCEIRFSLNFLVPVSRKPCSKWIKNNQIHLSISVGLGLGVGVKINKFILNVIVQNLTYFLKIIVLTIIVCACYLLLAS